jgi:PAS domain S-box-containing protein
MSVITVLWLIGAGVALTLAVVHTLVWLYDRRALANLTFAITALALACMAGIELQLMHTQSPEDYGRWIRWFQVPVFVEITGLVLFVHLYLRTARVWLGWTIVAVRFGLLVGNFLLSPNINFRRIISLDQVPLLGEQVWAVGQAEVGSWQWVAVLSLVLLTAFVIDAMAKLWRTGGPDAPRRALVVGGGILIFVLLSMGQTQLVIWGISRSPPLASPPFLITLLAMAFELSRDLLRAASLARKLRDSEQRLDLAASAAGLGIWVWDGSKRTVQTTEMARALYGLYDDRVIDFDRWLAAVHPDDVAGVRRGVEHAMANGGDFSAEYRVRLPDGTARWIAAHGRADADARGRPAVVRGVVRDVTERVQAQAETLELRRELAHSGRVTLLGQLSSALAHELSQPLGAILRNAEAAEMLLRAPTPDLYELREIVADIRRDDRRAGEVIERLRSLLRRRSVELHPLQLNALVEDVIALVRTDAVDRRVALEFTTTSGLPLAMGDRVHLSQVLLNLIVNGMDAVHEARRPDRTVVIETRHDPGGMLEVSVTDSGTGLSPEAAQRVFEPFFTTKANGMGMGLPVSRTIIEAHGGKLWVESAPGRGATFRFTVPSVGSTRQ